MESGELRLTLASTFGLANHEAQPNMAHFLLQSLTKAEGQEDSSLPSV